MRRKFVIAGLAVAATVGGGVWAEVGGGPPADAPRPLAPPPIHRGADGQPVITGPIGVMDVRTGTVRTLSPAEFKRFMQERGRFQTPPPPK